MNRSQVVLAGLAAGGVGASFKPAQVQKLFFVLDREAFAWLGGPHFSFKPYDYGPFDSEVYTALENASMEGHVVIDRSNYVRKYSLTSEGLRIGNDALCILHPEREKYLRDVAKWVNSLTFSQLVSSIYQKYPEMKVNSIFRS